MGLQDTLISHLSDRPVYVSRHPAPRAYMSEAGQCARKIALRIWHQGDTPAQHEPDAIRLTGLLAFKIGETVHDAVQAAMAKAGFSYRAFTPEVSCGLEGVGGRADGTYITQDGKLVVVEIKTKSPSQFKKFKESNKPDFDNVLQAVLGAIALKGQLVHIIYINKAAGYFESPILEWIYDLNDIIEDLDMPLGVAGEAEVARLQAIVSGAVQGEIPEPEYHGQVIVNPDKQFFPCTFCPFKEECKLMGPEAGLLQRFDDVEQFTTDQAIHLFTRENDSE